MSEPGLDNIHSIERVLRVFIGTSLIGSVFFIPVPFDSLIVLPLIGIYPCLTGIMGWDPVYYLADYDQTQLDFEFVPGPDLNTSHWYSASKFA